MEVNDRQMHIGLRPGDVGGYCLLPGDPERCQHIASYLDGAEFMARNREFVSYTGSLAGQRVSVCSTGIGGPSAAIAAEELAACGAHTLIRVGTCGGIDLAVRGGDLVVATGAVRQEGTGLHYLPIEFPAVADFEVTDALRRGAAQVGGAAAVHTGVVQSTEWKAWKQAGVLCSEMESAALFVVSAVLGLRAGAVFAVLWNQERQAAGLANPECMDTDLAVRAAVEGLRCLIQKDQADG